MALDIIETKLFKEPKETTENYFPKYRSNWTFKSKAVDFINFPKIINGKKCVITFYLMLEFLIFPWQFIILIALRDKQFALQIKYWWVP